MGGYDPPYQLCPNGEMRRNHHYYYQMWITGVSHVYFYVWTPSAEANNFLFVDVAKDPKLCEKILEKFNTLFMKCILPELLTCSNDPSSENNDQYYCFCRRPSFPPMVACNHRLQMRVVSLFLCWGQQSTKGKMVL